MLVFPVFTSAFAHADGLSAMRQFHEVVPLRSLQVNASTLARLDSSMPFIQGTACRRAHLRLVPIDRTQVLPHVFWLYLTDIT